MDYLCDSVQTVYGMSLQPDTKERMMIFKDEICEKCNKSYNNYCKPCQISYINENFGNWTSGNEKIDGFIQEMQLTTNFSWNITVEWISYNQFVDIKKICNNNSATIYSAIWKDGPFNYYNNAKRNPNQKVILKCLRYTTTELLNEVLNNFL